MVVDVDWSYNLSHKPMTQNHIIIPSSPPFPLTHTHTHTHLEADEPTQYSVPALQTFLKWVHQGTPPLMPISYAYVAEMTLA